MENIKEGFLQETCNRKVKCAEIKAGNRTADLRINYSESDYKTFLEELDLNYKEQEVYGYIWYSNNDWSERKQYEGWWEYRTTPTIPKNLKNKLNKNGKN